MDEVAIWNRALDSNEIEDLMANGVPPTCLDGVGCGCSDINLNGDVDFADFVILSTDFGKTSPYAAEGVANIPEPPGIARLMMGAIMLVFRRR